MIKAVIFDIGATLVTGPPIAPNKVIASLLQGKASASEVASVIMTRPFTCSDDVCCALAEQFGALPDEATQGIEKLWESQCDAACGIEGAVECVRELHNRGFRIGLLSDIWSSYYASVVKALPEVMEAATSVVLSCETGARKPDRANFLRILSDLEVEPGEAVMVGDTYTHDIEPAILLGMKAIWVLARPDREIESVLGVLNGELPHPTAAVASICDVVNAVLLTTTIETGSIDKELTR